ncbi:MAG TPA: aspartyl/glutamyl-tRNA amidotransferase subunit C [Anaerolineaceae bacterium]
MNDTITQEIFAHLVDLAALQLSAEEAEYLRQQLNQQINAIHELESIPLEADVPLSSHGVPYPPAISPEPRDDTWRPYPHPEDILGQAPQVEAGYIVVPDIPHIDLE